MKGGRKKKYGKLNGERWVGESFISGVHARHVDDRKERKRKRKRKKVNTIKEKEGEKKKEKKETQGFFCFPFVFS